METLTPDAALRPLWDCDPTDGRDECNLAEFPLASLASRTAPGQKTLSFTDEIWDKGTQQRIVRKLTISGSDQFGLPTARDNDVLVSLLSLTKCRNNFQSPKVHFTRYELVKFMHWDDGGKSYRRLERSLNVLAGVTLYYNRAWWDLAGKSWRNQTFHILESVDLRGRESAGANEQPLSSITWNGTLFAQLHGQLHQETEYGDLLPTSRSSRSPSLSIPRQTVLSQTTFGVRPACLRLRALGTWPRLRHGPTEAEAAAGD